MILAIWYTPSLKNDPITIIIINPIGNDLFLEREIRSHLLVLLRLYCCEEAQSSVDFTASIPGVVSFTDL